MLHPVRRGALSFALVLLVLAAAAAWQVSVIPSVPAGTSVGPAAMPAAVVAGLSLLSLVYLARAWRGSAPDMSTDANESPLEGAGGRLGLALAGLASMLALIGPAGVGPACVSAFVLFARAFDSRRPVRDLFVGIIVVGVLWGVFDRLLGVQLGPLVRGPG